MAHRHEVSLDRRIWPVALLQVGLVDRGYAIYPHRGYLHGPEAEAAEAARS